MAHGFFLSLLGIACRVIRVFGAFFLHINKLMRIWNGNTTTSTLGISFVNADGVMGRHRPHELEQLASDIVAISETHLDAQQQKLLKHLFPGFDGCWGASVTGKKGAIGFLVKSGSCWHAKLLEFSSTSPCAIFFRDGRLAVLSLHPGNGNRQFLIYNAYGYSGARWNAALKKYTHNLIEAALTDAASRGLPAIFGGDWNLQMEESMVLQRMSQHDWYHIPSICGMSDEPTCYKGPGSAIDHVFFNALAMSAFQYFSFGYQVSDHRSLTCTIGLGVISQTALRNRSLQTLPAGFIFPDVLSQPVCDLDPRFQRSLQKGDVADCYKIWCQYAEKHLKHLWQRIDASAHFTPGRGAVRLSCSLAHLQT